MKKPVFFSQISDKDCAVTCIEMILGERVRRQNKDTNGMSLSRLEYFLENIFGEFVKTRHKKDKKFREYKDDAICLVRKGGEKFGHFVLQYDMKVYDPMFLEEIAKEDYKEDYDIIYTYTI